MRGSWMIVIEVIGKKSHGGRIYVKRFTRNDGYAWELSLDRLAYNVCWEMGIKNGCLGPCWIRFLTSGKWKLVSFVLDLRIWKCTSSSGLPVSIDYHWKNEVGSGVCFFFPPSLLIFTNSPRRYTTPRQNRAANIQIRTLASFLSFLFGLHIMHRTHIPSPTRFHPHSLLLLLHLHNPTPLCFPTIAQ